MRRLRKNRSAVAWNKRRRRRNESKSCSERQRRPWQRQLSSFKSRSKVSANSSARLSRSSRLKQTERFKTWRRNWPQPRKKTACKRKTQQISSERCERFKQRMIVYSERYLRPMKRFKRSADTSERLKVNWTRQLKNLRVVVRSLQSLRINWGWSKKSLLKFRKRKLQKWPKWIPR